VLPTVYGKCHYQVHVRYFKSPTGAGYYTTVHLPGLGEKGDLRVFCSSSWWSCAWIYGSLAPAGAVSALNSGVLPCPLWWQWHHHCSLFVAAALHTRYHFHTTGLPVYYCAYFGHLYRLLVTTCWLAAACSVRSCSAGTAGWTESSRAQQERSYCRR